MKAVMKGLGLSACFVLAGCRVEMPGTQVDRDADAQIASRDCPFGLCLEPIPGDTAGRRALAERVADSALAMGLQWLHGGGAGQKTAVPFRWIRQDSLGFSLGATQHGLFPRLDVTVRVRGASGEYALTRFSRAGQKKSLAGFPALARLDYEGQVVLAGNANIHGPILMWRGEVRIATDFNVRYTGGTRNPTVWKSENPLWKTLPFTFPGAMEWFAAQDSILRAPDSALPGDDPWFADTLIAGSAVLSNITLENKRIVAPGGLTLGAGCVLRNCAVIAADARIEDDARIENSLVLGRDKLLITGSPVLTGQFLARDSLRLDIQSTLAGYPIFYAHGNPVKGAQINAVRAKGEAILFFGGDKPFQYPAGYHMVVGDSVNIKGLIYANGTATMDGTLEGSVLMEKNMFLDRGGTTYVGFIRNAQLRPPDPAMLLPLPLLIEPYEEAVLSSWTSGAHKDP